MGQAEDILAALGGADNIDELGNCATRLRLDLHDASIINEKALKAAGAFGVMKKGNSVQVIVGGVADGLAMDLHDIID